MKFIPYFGNKRKEIQHIVPFIPKNINTIVDVFGGSGCVGISIKEYSKGSHLVYNDVNKRLLKLIMTIQNFNNYKDIDTWNKNISSIKYFKTIEECKLFFYRQRNKVKDDNLLFIINCLYSQFNTYYICNYTKFHLGVIKRQNGLYTLSLTRINFDEFQDTYNTIDNISNTDYKTLLNNHKDDPNIFLYLDPPYLDTTSFKDKNYTNNFHINDVEYLQTFMVECKCKVMLNVNYQGKYKDFDNVKNKYKGNYHARSGNDYQHCIITNY